MEDSKKDAIRNLILTGIIAVAFVAAVWIFSTAIAVLSKNISTATMASNVYELVGYDGVVYRINKSSGRTDILYPGSDGAILIPVWQMNPGSMDRSGLTEEEQENWVKISRSLADYISGKTVSGGTA